MLIAMVPSSFRPPPSLGSKVSASQPISKASSSTGWTYKSPLLPRTHPRRQSGMRLLLPMILKGRPSAHTRPGLDALSAGGEVANEITVELANNWHERAETTSGGVSVRHQERLSH